MNDASAALKLLNEPDLSLKVTARNDAFQPFPHQKAAWDKLTKRFLNDKVKAGIVVVPTGGGKTSIAARWLLENHVRNGGRVLWFAHRGSLLRQAFQDFAKAGHLAAPLKTLNLIRVSSKDKPWSCVSREHDVVFSSIQSAARIGNLDFVKQFESQSKNGLFVVVDEAHHAAAPSYRRVLKVLRNAASKLMGLTATPVRMRDDEERRLWSIFDGNLLYEISRRELIQSGILAEPTLETVRTGIEMEREFTPEDEAHLSRFGELAPRVLERLAKNAPRNKLIVEHYVKYASKYGKTILFAVDTLHAQTLATEFKRAGVQADYIDYTRGNSGEIMDDFREKPEPVVIINVEMLTEGYDAPKTQTVFIARPSRSEALLSQMVGRALRGPKAGGTKEAHLVTFVDTWSEYHVLDTEVVIKIGDTEPTQFPQVRPELIRISAELVAEAYKLIQSVAKGFFEGCHACLPHAWFEWEEEFEDDINRRLVLVFDNQREGYEKLRAELLEPGKLPDEITEDYAREVVRRYFRDIPDPVPALRDIMALLVAHGKKQEVKVFHYTFEEKDRFDPRVLADELKDQLPSLSSKLQAIYDNDAVCRIVYRDDFPAFYKEVWDAVGRINMPPAPTVPEIVAMTPSGVPSAWPAGEPGFNLSQFWDAVTNQRKHFPKGAPAISDLRFSDAEKPLRAAWGCFRTRDRSIVISTYLNSPDIPLFVLEFLVYHEALHADRPDRGHDNEFRERERRFIPSEKAVLEAKSRGLAEAIGPSPVLWRALADQFLDTMDRRFLFPFTRKHVNY